MAITVITAAPLFVSYLNGTEGLEVITDIHVWVGVIWVLIALSNFVFFRRPIFQFRRHM